MNTDEQANLDTQDEILGSPASRKRARILSVLFILGPVLALALGVYGLVMLLDGEGTGPAIGIGILFVLPASLGAIASLLMDPYKTTKKSRRLAALFTVLFVLLIGGVIVREGIICILMLMPIWVLSVMVGVALAEKLRKVNRDRDKLNVSIFALLPFMVLGADMVLPQPTSDYQVSRAITIDAPIEQVWPHLLRMDDIKQTEGRWTVSQNVLRIPRPRSAIVEGEKLSARRTARWGEHIRFEEHITQWEAGQRLHWTFAFPDDSISRYTDRHISPKGEHLNMKDGGYRLIPLVNGQTKLVLDTNYTVTTPINLYSKLWGELILGDIQNNVLQIVKDRSEQDK